MAGLDVIAKEMRFKTWSLPWLLAFFVLLLLFVMNSMERRLNDRIDALHPPQAQEVTDEE